MAGRAQSVHQGNQSGPNTTPTEQNFYFVVTKHMSDVNTALQNQSETMNDLKAQISSLQGNQNVLYSKFSLLERRYNELRSYTCYLEDYCLELDVNSRKSHVILTGVQEEDSESSAENKYSQVTFDKAVDLLSNICDTVTSADLEAVYRIGKPGRSPRPILIKFVRESVRNEVMKKKKLLKESDETRHLFMNEDLPPIINKRRSDMRAVVDNARNKNVPASMAGNRMIVNDITYEYKDIHSLPPGLKLADAKLQAVKGGFAFQSEYAFLSNFYPCEISFNNMFFRSSEQLYQYERAIFANNTRCANDILNANTPQAAKREGFRVGNSPGWDRVKLTKMKDIVTMKFDQNPVLKNELLKTGEANLIEASHDTFWGAGLPLNAKKLREGKWHGHNHLGKILVNYRYEVRRSLPPPTNPPVMTQSQNQFPNAPPIAPSNTQVNIRPVSHVNTSGLPCFDGKNPTYQVQSFQPNQATSNGLPQFGLPVSQTYQTQVFPSTYQGLPPSSYPPGNTSPLVYTGYSPVSDSYSTHGERRMEYDPNMSPQFTS